MKASADKFDNAAYGFNIFWQIFAIAFFFPSAEVLQKIPITALLLLVAATAICVTALFRKQFNQTEGALTPILIFALANWIDSELLIETIDFASSALFGCSLIIAAAITFKASR